LPCRPDFPGGEPTSSKGAGMSDSSSSATSVSLLQQLGRTAAPATQQAWNRFVQLYTPLLLMWSRRLGVKDEDAPDLLQDVFLVLAGEMPAFRYDPTRRFRGWLWTVLVNKCRDRARHGKVGPPPGTDAGLSGAALPDNVEEYAEEEYRAYLVGRALEIMKA